MSIALSIVLCLGGLLASPVGAADTAPASAAKAKDGLRLEKLLSQWSIGGSLSFNWRGVGPREPGFETQIQHEAFLSDIYFDFHGPVLDDVPFRMEFNFPTSGRGVPNLYQMFFEYDRVRRWRFQLGKFLVPFGRYNELYRPDMFMTVTRPLLYASPDSLDLVVRINSPRPPFSSGYTDIGVRTSYYTPWRRWWLPDELTFYVVNGLSENNNRLRTFPSPENLGITPPPASGVAPDFDHDNNNLADNNNNKAIGGRIVYWRGSPVPPWPIPEGRHDLKAVLLGLSAMGGQYNLESQLNYRMIGVDLGFEYQGAALMAEYMYSFTQLQNPLTAGPGSSTLLNENSANVPLNFHTSFEEMHGGFVQAVVPLWRRPLWGKRVSGIVVYNHLQRRGERLSLLQNKTIDGTFYESIAAHDTSQPRLKTYINKVTIALNYQLTDFFIGKLEHSYWFMGRASTFSPTTDIYQSALSIVMAF
ncbi:MAG: hypothetical protein ABIJ96_04750 [Elusimicrobiota bacterium]